MFLIASKINLQKTRSSPDYNIKWEQEQDTIYVIYITFVTSYILPILDFIVLKPLCSDWCLIQSGLCLFQYQNKIPKISEGLDMGGEEKKISRIILLYSNVCKRINISSTKWDRKYGKINQSGSKEYEFAFRDNEFQVSLMHPSTGVQSTLGIHFLSSMENPQLEIYI